MADKKKQTTMKGGAEPRVRVMLALSPALYTRIVEQAQTENVSITEWCRVALAAALAQADGAPVHPEEV